MSVDLDHLVSRSAAFALGGLVAVMIGWFVLSAAFDGGGGLYQDEPSTAAIVAGWGLVVLGGMAIQASIVGWLIAGSAPGALPGDEGVVMHGD